VPWKTWHQSSVAFVSRPETTDVFGPKRLCSRAAKALKLPRLLAGPWPAATLRILISLSTTKSSSLFPGGFHARMQCKHGLLCFWVNSSVFLEPDHTLLPKSTPATVPYSTLPFPRPLFTVFRVLTTSNRKPPLRAFRQQRMQKHPGSPRGYAIDC
jgi:hypothetical protein